jgi:hypothetical protein
VQRWDGADRRSSLSSPSLLRSPAACLLRAYASAHPDSRRSTGIRSSRACRGGSPFIGAPAGVAGAALSCTEPFGLGRPGVDRWRCAYAPRKTHAAMVVGLNVLVGASPVQLTPIGKLISKHTQEPPTDVAHP